MARLSTAVLAAAAALLLCAASAAAQATPDAPTLSSSCSTAECEVVWTIAADVVQYELWLTVDGVRESSALCITGDRICDIAAQTDLYECVNYKIELLIEYNSGRSDFSEPLPISIAPSSTVSAPIIRTLDARQDRMILTFDTSSATPRQWVANYTLEARDNTSTLVASEDVFLDFAADVDTTSLTETITGLTSGTSYEFTVVAVPCAGASVDSSPVERFTSTNVVVPGNTDNEVTVYIRATFVITNINVASYDEQKFFVGILSALWNDEKFSTTEVSLARLATLELEKTSASNTVVVEIQQRTTSTIVESVKAALQNIVDASCDSSLLTWLDATTSGEYSSSCIDLDAAPSHSTTDATRSTNSGSSSGSGWEIYAIIAGAIVGGILLIAAIVYLAIEMRQIGPKKPRSESRVNLGVELRDASLY